MVEAYGLTSSPLFRRPAQRGIDFIHACKNPGRAWRYGLRPGDDDTSVTGWMVMALKSAVEAGLDVHPADILDAVDVIDGLTGPDGRVSYTASIVGPVRPAGKADEYPDRYSESLTAVGMLCRIFGGQDPAESEDIARGARLCSRQTPEWERPKLDFYYWYYGTLALYQVGGDPWERWNRDMIGALLPNQRKEPECLRGSWDPIDAWGEEGGRVYATALLTMCLEVYYRYPRVFGR